MRKLQSLYLLLFIVSPHISAQQLFTDTVQLSQVTVTAEKRSQRIIEIPASVTSISASRVESENAKSLRNLSGIAPNFYMPEYGSKLTAPVYIRGVGSRINSPSVGLYVDRVPYFEKSMFAFDFADVERIEVLRGPQGTLYGKNTMGGIINIITKAPKNYRELQLSADIGNFGYMKYRFLYNEPIGKTLSLLISGGYTEHDGYFTNQFHNEDVGNDFTKNGLIKLRFNPSKSLIITLKSGAERSYEVGYPYGILDSTNKIKTISYNRPSRYSRDIMDNSLNISLYKEKFIVTSVSSIQYLKDKQEIDQDFMPKDYYLVKQGVKQNLYSQEVVITNTNSRWIDATAGVFGFIQDANRDIDLLYGSDAKEVKLVSGNGYLKYNNEENSGGALFGQATLKKLFNFIDITLGLRYDREQNKLNYTYLTTTPSAQTLKKDTVFTSSFNELLPKVAIRFSVLPNTSVYSVFSTGYRGGGFNTAFVRPEDEVYKPEDSYNYEFGIKSNIIPDVLSANVALFYIDWNNQQVSQRVPVGGNMYKNAGKTYSKGIETEIIYNPLNNLQIGGNFGYTQAKYEDFQPNLQADVNYKGNYLPFVPRYTFSTNASYKLNLKGNYLKSLLFSCSAQGVGKQYWDDANAQVQDSYFVVNSVVSAETPWFMVSLWGKNLLDCEYYPYRFYIDQFKNWYAQRGNPLTFGVSLSVKISGKQNFN